MEVTSKIKDIPGMSSAQEILKIETYKYINKGTCTIFIDAMGKSGVKVEPNKKIVLSREDIENLEEAEFMQNGTLIPFGKKCNHKIKKEENIWSDEEIKKFLDENKNKSVGALEEKIKKVDSELTILRFLKYILDGDCPASWYKYCQEKYDQIKREKPEVLPEGPLENN